MADFKVDPDVLRSGAPRIFDASEQVGDAGALVRTAEVPGAALGDVEGAAVFSRAVGEFVRAHGGDLEHGSVWIDDAADGLIKAADEYERTEDRHTNMINEITGE